MRREYAGQARVGSPASTHSAPSMERTDAGRRWPDNDRGACGVTRGLCAELLPRRCRLHGRSRSRRQDGRRPVGHRDHADGVVPRRWNQASARKASTVLFLRRFGYTGHARRAPGSQSRGRIGRSCRWPVGVTERAQFRSACCAGRTEWFADPGSRVKRSPPTSARPPPRRVEKSGSRLANAPQAPSSVGRRKAPRNYPPAVTRNALDGALSVPGRLLSRGFVATIDDAHFKTLLACRKLEALVREPQRWRPVLPQACQLALPARAAERRLRVGACEATDASLLSPYSHYTAHRGS